MTEQLSPPEQRQTTDDKLTGIFIPELESLPNNPEDLSDSQCVDLLTSVWLDPRIEPKALTAMLYDLDVSASHEDTQEPWKKRVLNMQKDVRGLLFESDYYDTLESNPDSAPLINFMIKNKGDEKNKVRPPAEYYATRVLVNLWVVVLRDSRIEPSKQIDANKIRQVFDKLIIS